MLAKTHTSFLPIQHGTLLDNLRVTARECGLGSPSLGDQFSGYVGYAKLVQGSKALSAKLSNIIQSDEANVGILLPTGVAAVMAFFALHFMGRVPTMLNFVGTTEQVETACRLSCLRNVITSRSFIDIAHLNGLAKELTDKGIRLLYLEDIKNSLTLFDKLYAGLAGFLFYFLPSKPKEGKADKPAVILFTSGSEGLPKGVALSHGNILSNIAQFTQYFKIRHEDRLFNCLPIYHSFGLTVGVFLPLMTGIRSFLYPSPLHYHAIPTLIREQASTLFLSTDTFLQGYAHHGMAQDFKSLRFIVAGAEKLKKTTIDVWNKRFGKTIYEGYGVTEASPVLSFNTFEAIKEGSVGRFLPNLAYRIKTIEGIERGGELWVKGPNIMLGYLKEDNPCHIQKLEDDWHNTGDVVDVDDEGFVTIIGRLKRFAKVGGEMVSLAHIEQIAEHVWQKYRHCAVPVPHARKGEVIVLLTEYDKARKEDLLTYYQDNGISTLLMPKHVFHVVELPLLGSGKTDVIKVQTMASALVAALESPPR